MVIFYFSGTGNTRYASEYLNEKMNDLGKTCEVVDIVGLSSQIAKTLIEENDIVFLAYPIYGSDMPDNMMRFIEEMPDGKGKSLGVVCTQMLFSGDGASIMWKKLKNKGYVQKWAYQINMPNNLCMKGSPLGQNSDYEYIEKKYLIKARAIVDEIANFVVEDKIKIKDHGFFHWLAAQTQRPLYRKSLKKTYVHGLGVDEAKCNLCEICVRICPNDVIVNDNKIIFENKDACTVCFRCLDFCPQSAITYKGGVKEPLYKGPTKQIFNSIIKNK